MADYVHGKMNIEQQKSMFNSFWGAVVRAGGLIIVILLLMYIFLT